MNAQIPESISATEISTMTDQRVLRGLSRVAGRRAREAVSAAARERWSRLMLLCDQRLGELRKGGATIDPSFSERVQAARDAIQLAEPQAVAYVRRVPDRTLTRPPAPTHRSAPDPARTRQRAADVRRAINGSPSDEDRRQARELLRTMRGGQS